MLLVLCPMHYTMAHLYFLLLLVAFFGCTIAKEIPGFWSIYCGGGEGFVDENTNLTWVSDEGFVRTGVGRQDKDGFFRRVFPSEKTKKNCYTIPVGKGVKILVRLTFYYGNYDGLGSPPEMELIFDGYDWGTLETSMEGGDWMELIYVTKSNNTNICLGRADSDQDPFVSYIEVRTLELNMYSHVNESKLLRVRARDAFGADDMIRYPYDRYDRYWFPRSEGFTVLRSDTNYTNTTNWRSRDDPPALLTRTAVGPLNRTSTQLNVSLWNLPTDPTPLYFNIYFSEMSNKTIYGSRAFNLFVDGIQLTENPIIPPYQSLDQYYSSSVAASNGTVFQFVSIKNATLPPIISIMEVCRIRDASEVTFENDVVALGILQESFTSLQNWTGDPCLPVDYNWEWVVCNSDSTPRIKELHLGGYELSGFLPDFSNLTALEIIDLHNNSLTGDIPAFLGSLPSLTTLNLSMNNFSSIPSTLTQSTTIKLDVTGNPNLCKPGVTCDDRTSFRSEPPPPSLFTRSPPPSSPPIQPPPPPNSAGVISNRVTIQVFLLQMAFFVSTVFVI